MINQKLIHLFSQLAEYLEMDDVPFKPRAYQRVVLILENLEEDLIDVYRSGGREALKKIPGIGEGLADKIEEFIKTGKMKELEALKKKVPVDLAALSRLEGLGPKTIKVLYKKLGVKNLTDLERAAKTGQIKKLEHFGQKSEENILSAIEFSKRDQGRFLLGFLSPEVEKLKNKLAGLKEIERIEIAGSLRRQKETIGDIDLLAVSRQPQKVVDFFVSLSEVEKVYGAGKTKVSVRLNWGIDVDLRIVEKSHSGRLGNTSRAVRNTILNYAGWPLKKDIS